MTSGCKPTRYHQIPTQQPIFMSLATIILRNLKLSTLIGVYEHERLQEQTIRVDFELGLQKNRSAHSDQLEDTVDYDDVARTARQFAKLQRAELLERFAYELGLELMRRYPLRTVDLTAWKAVPGLLPAEVAVRVQMDRSELNTHALLRHRDEDDRYND